MGWDTENSAWIVRSARLGGGAQTATVSITQRFESYQPSKTFLVWACVATAVATMIIGFIWAGWVTGGTSRAAARRGEFSLCPMLMALMRANKSAGWKAG